MFDLNLSPIFKAMLLEHNVTAAAAHMGLTHPPIRNALSRPRHYFDDSRFWHPRFANAPPIRWFPSLLIELFREPPRAKKARK